MYLAAPALSCSTGACGIFCSGMLTLSRSVWDLVPWSGIEPGPSALGAWSLSHWPTREHRPPHSSWCWHLLHQGLPGGSDGKESACKVGDLGSIPAWGTSPGEGNAPSTPVFQPGEFLGQRSLAGFSPWVAKSWARLSNFRSLSGTKRIGGRRSSQNLDLRDVYFKSQTKYNALY